MQYETTNKIDIPDAPINAPALLPTKTSGTVNKPAEIPKFSAKFKTDWTQKFSTKLASDQEAFCLSETNRKSFNFFEEWIFVVNTAPVVWDKDKSVVGIETPCAVFSGIIDQKPSEINLTIGDTIIAEGYIEKDNVINFWKFLKVR